MSKINAPKSRRGRKSDQFVITVSDARIRRLVASHELIEENSRRLLEAITAERLGRSARQERAANR